MIVGTESFLQTEDKWSGAFLSKPRKGLRNEQLTFNGVTTCLDNDKQITITRQKNTLELEMSTTEEAFRSHRAIAEYLGVKCRPDNYATMQIIASGNGQL